MLQMDEFSNGMSLDRFNRLCDVYPFGTYDAVATLAAAETVPVEASSGRSRFVVGLAAVFAGVGTSVCAVALFYVI